MRPHPIADILLDLDGRGLRPIGAYEDWDSRCRHCRVDASLLGGCSTPVSAPPPVIDLKVEHAEASTAAVNYGKARVNIASETTIKYSRERMAPF